MLPRLIPANTYRRERWRNGLGWTREIARFESADSGSSATVDDAAPDFDWRLSIAEIERDCDFSRFPGCDRHLVLLTGNGVRLRLDDDEQIDVLPAHGRIAFAGERAVHCVLIDGPTHDFNVMVRRDRMAAQVLHRPLVGSMVFFREPGVSWAIHLLAGGARSKDQDLVLAPGDTLLLESDGAPSSRYIIDGAGEALLVRFQRVG
ncbi:MAG: HutD family protein [Lysobacteraceae bacterium]